MQRLAKVVLTDVDRFPPSDEDMRVLEQAGIQLVGVPSEAARSELVDKCKDASGLLVFGTRINRELIEQMEKCKVISRCGTGFNNIDLKAAREKGIVVTYVPDYAIEEVADHTITLMLDCLRKVTSSHSLVQQGQWPTYSELRPMRRLSSMTLGLLGFGRIARATALRAKVFGLRIIAHDPLLPDHVIKEAGAESVSLENLLANADILSLHTPLTAKTHHIISTDELNIMKDGAILINTSRGPLIDETALVDALQSGRIGSAGLDVLESEPMAPNHLFLALKQVVVTPHSAAFSEESLSEVKLRAIYEVIRVLHGQEPHCPVPSE